jgi:hypothetical protein
MLHVKLETATEEIRAMNEEVTALNIELSSVKVGRCRLTLSKPC